jgi:hypothetical protein
MMNHLHTANAAEAGEEVARIRRLYARYIIKPVTDRSMLHGWTVKLWTLHVHGRENEIVGTVGLLVRPMNTSEVHNGQTS